MSIAKGEEEPEESVDARLEVDEPPNAVIGEELDLARPPTGSLEGLVETEDGVALAILPDVSTECEALRLSASVIASEGGGVTSVSRPLSLSSKTLWKPANVSLFCSADCASRAAKARYAAPSAARE